MRNRDPARVAAAEIVGMRITVDREVFEPRNPAGILVLERERCRFSTCRSAALAHQPERYRGGRAPWWMVKAATAWMVERTDGHLSP